MPPLPPWGRTFPLAVILLLADPPPLLALDTGWEGKAQGTSLSFPYAEGNPSESLLDLSVRFQLREKAASFSAEAHLLAGLTLASDPVLLVRAPNPFRVFDLEGERPEGGSRVWWEADRLVLEWDGGRARLTAGRQALTWGEAWYFNPLDLFGAFPLTQVNRSWKPGVDSAALALALGSRGQAALVAVPEGDDPGSAAARVLLPLGGSVSLILEGGEVLADRVAGGGVEADLAGTRVVLESLFTEPGRGGETSFSQTVLSLQRQMDAKTHLTAEVFRNGWGREKPGERLGLAFSPRYLQGRIPSLGRHQASLDVSRQLTPLWTGSAALFGDLDDGSVLLRLDGAWSLSDESDLRVGCFAGLGERPGGEGGESEFGGAPLTVFLDAVTGF